MGISPFGFATIAHKTIRHRHPLQVELLEDRSLLSASSPEIFLLATPKDPSYGSLWGMAKIQAPSAWDKTVGSTNVVVADIDTGIDYKHIDLYKNIWINQAEIPDSVKAAIMSRADWDVDSDGLITFWDLNDSRNQGAGKITDLDSDGRITGADLLKSTSAGGWADGADTGANGFVDDLIGWDFVNNDNNPYDDNGHGTHVAGTIGAEGNNGVGVVGVNWKVQIMAIKILSASGSGDLWNAALAIHYARNNGARIANNSWGFYDSGETVRGTKYTYLYDAIKNPVNGPQMLFIAAAGNNGLNNDTHWARNYPASYDLSNIIAVAATTSNDGKASFSNYGTTTVDLGAPGQNILSTVPGDKYAYYSGTSMATPHVSGAAALLLAKNPTLNAADLKAAILTSVKKVNSMNKTVSGGRLDLNAAVIKAAGMTSSTSSTTSNKSGPQGFSFGILSGRTRGANFDEFEPEAIGDQTIERPSDLPSRAVFVAASSAGRSEAPTLFGVNIANGTGDSFSPALGFTLAFTPTFVFGSAYDAQLAELSFDAGWSQVIAHHRSVLVQTPITAIEEIPAHPATEPAVMAMAPANLVETPRIDEPVPEEQTRGFVVRSLSGVLAFAGAMACLAQGALLGQPRSEEEQKRA